MTDEIEIGFGWMESPEDARDWPIADAYALTGTAVPLTLPAVFRVAAPLPAVMNQGTLPQCVAYSSAWEQDWFDLRDTGGVAFDTNLFFAQIGGTPQGAFVRNALARRKNYGYPVAGSPGSAAQHRIAAYFAVPVTQDAIRAALVSFGPLCIGTPWAHSWIRPNTGGLLPAFDYAVGGHAIVMDGYDAQGVWLQNSWGPSWGWHGRACLPWSQLSHIREVWKAVDVLNKPVVQPEPPVTPPLDADTGTPVVNDATGFVTGYKPL